MSDYATHPIRLVRHVPQLTTGSERAQMMRRVEALSRAYTRKSQSYWRGISSRYFSDIVNRVLTMRSLKFLSLPPLRFYLEIGIRNTLKKIRLGNIFSIFSLAKR